MQQIGYGFGYSRSRHLGILTDLFLQESDPIEQPLSFDFMVWCGVVCHVCVSSLAQLIATRDLPLDTASHTSSLCPRCQNLRSR